jgi:hypothetical protein
MISATRRKPLAKIADPDVAVPVLAERLPDVAREADEFHLLEPLAGVAAAKHRVARGHPRSGPHDRRALASTARPENGLSTSRALPALTVEAERPRPVPARWCPSDSSSSDVA